MIITTAQPFGAIEESLRGLDRVFIVGCGECATTCKTGDEAAVRLLKEQLEKAGKTVVGWRIPKAPCVAAQVKAELARAAGQVRQAEALLVLACGLGVQSVKDNARTSAPTLPGCDTVFGATVDAAGNFLEKCSLCGACVLAQTGGICPVTLCPKGLLNGPCGGMNKGKCEVDKEQDCAWVLIYQEAQRQQKLDRFRAIRAPKDHAVARRPHRKNLAGAAASAAPRPSA